MTQHNRKANGDSAMEEPLRPQEEHFRQRKSRTGARSGPSMASALDTGWGGASECGLKASWAQIPEQTRAQIQLSMWDEPWEGSAVVTCSWLKSTLSQCRKYALGTGLCPQGSRKHRFLEEYV